MVIRIRGKDYQDESLSTEELQKAAYSLARHAHWRRVMSYADELEQQVKEAWAKYHAGGEREPDVHDMINDHLDGTLVYNLDIACALLASDNDTYAYDEGLIEANDPAAAAHYATVQDVTEELDLRGALEEPQPPSESSDADETSDESGADTERAPTFGGEETEVTGADGVVRKMRAKI